MKLKKIAASVAVALTLGVAATAAQATLLPVVDALNPLTFTTNTTGATLFTLSYDFHLGSGTGILGVTSADAPLVSFTAWLTGNGITGSLYPVSAPTLTIDPEYYFTTTEINFTGLNVGDYTLHISATGAAGTSLTTMISTVPEPGSFALMLAGLGLMAGISRRKSTAKAV
jgi:hypothetical protein